MLKKYQHTITKSVSLEGIGLHTGKVSKICILPGEPDKGIVFKRIDLDKNNFIEANYKNVSEGKLCTTLKNKNGIKVSTVEHLLAALFIAEIDNAIIEIDNEEVPIMDGSAKNFLEILKKTEIVPQSKKRKYLKILNNVNLKDGTRKIEIETSKNSFEVDFQLNYKNKIIGNQQNYINFNEDQLEDICSSRTFCLFEDIKKIKKLGLAKGGSLENAVVVDEEKVLNESGLRNPKEFVNHKILDLAGDFLLSGYRVIGKVKCYQGGHELTNMFLSKLFKNKNAFTCLEIGDVIISERKSTLRPSNLAVNA